ncbi:MAG TPA: hypothetical protein VLW65_22180 [Bryobacteraceae bacterium]|nr:hypothetical protein [Bryobacteraceae bacterium]
MTRITLIACVLLAIAGIVQAQTTSLNLTVGVEASITVTTGTTALANTGGNFTTPFTGTTDYSFKIRTKTTGTITVLITSDFTTATNGPSVHNPPTTGDALTFTCSATSPALGTPCASAQTASTTAAATIVGFGATVNSANAGNTGSIVWSLTDDPVYPAGSYTAVATFTISAT